MSNADLCYTSIADLSSLIEKGHLSPVDIIDTYLERIEHLDPALNTFITVTGDRARDELATEAAAAGVMSGAVSFQVWSVTISDARMLAEA